MCKGHVTRESVLLQLPSLVCYLNPSKVAELTITWFSGFSYLTGDCIEHFLYCSELGNCVVFSLKTTQWTCILILSPLLYTRNATNDIFRFAAGHCRQGRHFKTTRTLSPGSHAHLSQTTALGC